MTVQINKNNSTNTAVFGGGCFWCTEAIFRRVRGVISVEPGYAGGDEKRATYELVSTGATGHIEVVKVVFDPAVVSFNTLLDIFWATHDPTTRNQQGFDVGTQYRSVIFYTNDEQKKLALKSKKQEHIKASHAKEIITDILPLKHFYPAEEYHKNYYEKNTSAPYCTYIIAPKIQKLLEKFGAIVKRE